MSKNPHKLPGSEHSSEPQMPPEVGARMVAVRTALGDGQRQWGDHMGVSERTVQRYESGERSPALKHLAGLAVRGVNIHWLLTGDGDMLIGGGAEQPPTAAPGAPLDAPDAPSKTVAEQGVMALDAELMGRVVDAIRAVYKAQGQGLPDRTLGEIAARWYGDIAAVSADPGDRLDALAERQIGLRRELRDAATNAASGKQHRA